MPTHGRVHPPRPARDRHAPGQALHVLGRFRRRHRQLGRQVLRRLGQVRHARAQRRQPRVLQEPALARAASAGQQHQPRLLDAAVPEPLGQPAASEKRPPGRHAGQRHVAEQPHRRPSGIRSSTATAASPASAPATTAFASTPSRARRTTRTSGTATRRSG